jgi:hypothetical protein
MEGFAAMLSRKVVFVALAMICLAGVARAEDPIQQMGRYWGFGWGDGYHANRTWSLNCGPTSQKQVVPTPAQKPAAAPQELEPDSPSDRPVPKTGRRYPTQNGQRRR